MGEQSDIELGLELALACSWPAGFDPKYPLWSLKPTRVSTEPEVSPKNYPKTTKTLPWQGRDNWSDTLCNVSSLTLDMALVALWYNQAWIHECMNHDTWIHDTWITEPKYWIQNQFHTAGLSIAWSSSGN